MGTQLDKFGRTVEAYIAGCIHEAARDAVAFGDIVSYGIQQFEFCGDELEIFVRQVVLALLNAGARVVMPASAEARVDWKANSRYVFDKNIDVVERIVIDWKTTDDGYGFFAWFAMPYNQYGRERF